MSCSKFSAPHVGPSVDTGKFQKLALRIEKTLTETLFPGPKQHDPSLVLLGPNNREGAPPNVRHVHFGILASFKTNGFDRSRPAIGICIMYTSEKGKKKHLEHNLRFTKGNKLRPPIRVDVAIYGSLASSHFNLALRCLQAGIISPIGDLCSMLTENLNLNEVATAGHRWWILPESVCTESQVGISF